MAVKHGGETTAENLALSCLSCNRYKGSDFATIKNRRKNSDWSRDCKVASVQSS
ncbi:HNH endonuclease [Tolypothrix campylonemoides]|uniref:HNH endonuclease n=1 Tax=Tolypothrix campylonemoides TaxID=1136105 RepID=UPI0038B44E3C